MKRYALLMAGTFIAFASWGQDLKKEITIEREIVPEVRAVGRPAVYPSQLTFTGNPVDLDFRYTTELADYDPLAATLEPARPQKAFATPVGRGYVDLAYFPAANASLSAGYAAILQPKTRLNIWTQVDYARWHRNITPAYFDYSNPERYTFSDFDSRLGADFSQRFSGGTLTAHAAGGWSSITLGPKVTSDGGEAAGPVQFIYSSKERRIFDLDLKAGWQGRANGFDYRASLATGLYNNAINGRIKADYTPVRQTDTRLDAGLRKPLTDKSAITVDLGASWLHYNRFITPRFVHHNEVLMPEAEVSSATLGLYTLTPAYHLTLEKFSLKAGVRVDASTGGNYGRVRFAPDVNMALNVASGFGAWLKVDGGEQRNTFQQLDQYCRFTSPFAAYDFSRIPLAGALGLRFGPIKGCSLTAEVAYCMADRWLMPDYQWNCNALTYLPTDLRAFKLALEAIVRVAPIADVDIRYETLLGDKSDPKKAWAMWRDRATHVLNAKAAVRPVKPLSFELSYEMRLDRRITYRGEYRSIGNVNSLNLDASWQFNSHLSAFVSLRNMLDRNTWFTPDLPMRGFHGLVGIGYKF